MLRPVVVQLYLLLSTFNTKPVRVYMDVSASKFKVRQMSDSLAQCRIYFNSMMAV